MIKITVPEHIYKQLLEAKEPLCRFQSTDISDRHFLQQIGSVTVAICCRNREPSFIYKDRISYPEMLPIYHHGDIEFLWGEDDSDDVRHANCSVCWGPINLQSNDWCACAGEPTHLKCCTIDRKIKGAVAPALSFFNRCANWFRSIVNVLLDYAKRWRNLRSLKNDPGSHSDDVE